MDKIRKALYTGVLDLNGIQISCAVLDDGTRVLVNRSLANALGIKGGGAYWKQKKQGGALLPEYLSAKYLAPYISEGLKLTLSNPIPYSSERGILSEAIPAENLSDICDVYIQAEQKGAFSENQDVAQKAYAILLAFSKVGIIALVDEATGYVKDKNRAKDELQKFLQSFIQEEAAKLVKRFEDSFFESIYKMKGWTWTYTHKHPSVVGKYINDLVYERLAPLVLAELRKKNPMIDGHRKHKHHQFLTEDVGIPRLMTHLSSLEAFARAANYNWAIFMDLVDRAYPKQNQQLKFFFDDIYLDDFQQDKDTKDTFDDSMGKILGFSVDE